MKTILLADDSVTIQKVVELTFSDVPGDKYSVMTASNGDDAIRILAERRPDIVIADVHMPGADGFEVCRRARLLRPPVPVLLLVGSFEPFDPEQSSRAGAEGFLKKPFDSQELLRRVQELLARAPEPRSAPFGFQEDPIRPFEESVLSAADPMVIVPEARLVEKAPDPAPSWTPPLPSPATSASERISPTVASPPSGTPGLTDAEVDRIARRVVELLSEKVVREVAWEVVPDLAEILVKDRIREIETAAD